MSHSGRRRRRSNSALPNWQQQALLILLLCAGLVLASNGSRLLVSGLAGYQVQVFIDDWRSKNAMPSPAAWAVAEAAANRAVAWYPGVSGKHLEQRGHLYQWQHYQLPYADAQASSARQASIDSLRQAIAARPHWPDNHLALANGKLLQWQLDDEFSQALQQASYYGPYRPRIQLGLARIGLQAWPALKPAAQQLIIQSIERSLLLNNSNAARQLASLATSYADLNSICQQLDKATPRSDILCAGDTERP